MIVSNINNMITATDRLQEFFDNLLAFCDQTTKSQEDQILLAGCHCLRLEGPLSNRRHV